MNQQQLFSIELRYEKGKPQVLDAPGRTGEYLGSGVGTISGEKVNGSVQWDLFEKVDDTGRMMVIGGMDTPSESENCAPDNLPNLHYT